MNCVKRKLKSTGGASIIIALLFFLICCTVGVSVLAAAKANASRLVSQRESEEAYLAVRSAAMLMREKMETSQSQPFTECEEIYDNATTWKQLSTENPTNSFWKKIENGMYQLIQKESGSESCAFIFQAEDIPDVSANVTISKKEGKYTLQGLLSCVEDPAAGDVYTYLMTLTETGEPKMTHREPITKIVENEDGSTSEKIIGERRQYTISFSNGQLEVTN